MDFPYLIFYILLIAQAYFYWNTHDKRIINFSFSIAFIFFAFRAPVVGADTWNYVRYITGERYFYNEDPRPLEPLFVAYRNIVCSITNSRFIVMIINSIVSFAPLYYITKKYSINPSLTILFFCFLGGMSIYFCALRQIIALSVLYIALIYWIKHEGHYLLKISLLVCCMVTAYNFHTTSALYSFIFIIALIPYHIKRSVYIASIVGSAVVGILMEKFNVLETFSFVLNLQLSSFERLNGYMINADLKNGGALNILLRLSVFAIISYCFMSRERVSHPFCKIFLIEVIVFNLFHSVPMIHRICYPLSLFGAVILTWGLEKRANRNIPKIVVNTIFVLLVAYYFRSQVIESYKWDMNDEGRMHPYYFIFQDYSNHPSITKF